MTIANKHCHPCSQKDTLPLSPDEVKTLLAVLQDWRLAEDGNSIRKKFRFCNFERALGFVNRIAEIAEQENHHPDVAFGWGYCELTLTTHAIHGLHENDFIIAAKIDTITIGQDKCS